MEVRRATAANRAAGSNVSRIGILPSGSPASGGPNALRIVTVGPSARKSPGAGGNSRRPGSQVRSWKNMGERLTLTCKAVLFDMDGTLVDSTRVVELAWGWWAARHQIPLDAVLAFSHGRPTIDTMEHFRPGRDHTAELE